MLIIDRDNFLWKMNLVKTKKKTKKRQYTRNMYSNLSKKKKRCGYLRRKYRKNLSKEEKHKKDEYSLNFLCMYKNYFYLESLVFQANLIEFFRALAFVLKYLKFLVRKI